MEQAKTIRPRNWVYELLVCLELLLIVGIWWAFSDSWKHALIFGGLTYLILAWALRLILQRHHRKGMHFLRRKNYEAAAEAFRNSHRFYESYPWVDQYRFITMFSSSAFPYRQMALNNLGICYLHMGENITALNVFKELAALNSAFPHIHQTIQTIQSHIDEESEC